MSNQWLRLWHDMPNDPKWRTISRISGQPIALVISLYVHLLVDASRNVTRGHVDVTTEDLASALDVTERDIESILSAMQGRVLDGDRLSGWDVRQVKREDDGNEKTGAKSAAERKRDQRSRQREAARQAQYQTSDSACHDASRNVTTDKDTDKSNTPTSLRSVGERAHATGEGVTVPADLQPDRSTAANLKTLNVDPGFELAKFIAHHEAQGTTLADGKAWQAKLRKWLLDAHQFNADRNRVTDARVQAAQSHSQTRQDAITAAADALGVGSQYLQHHTQGATHAIEN